MKKLIIGAFIIAGAIMIAVPFILKQDKIFGLTLTDIVSTDQLTDYPTTQTANNTAIENAINGIVSTTTMDLVTSIPNLVDVGTITDLAWTRASGTQATLTTLWLDDGTITSFDFTNASGTSITYGNGWGTNLVLSGILDVTGDAAFGDITFDTGTSSGTLFINEICNAADECWSSPSAEGSAVVFYPNNNNAGTGTPEYEDMLITPTSGMAIDESCSAEAGVDGGYCLIDTYISTTTDITILNYPAGTTQINAYSYVSSAAGVSTLEFRGYRLDSGGTKYYMGAATTSDINAGSVAAYTTTFAGSVDTAFSADGTDRLLMEVRAHTTSAAAKTIHWTYQSSGNYSHMVTPITTKDLGYTKSFNNEAITGTWTFDETIVGNIDTATALAANPTDCSGGEVATGIGANGNLVCQATSTNADTATALASNPADCTNQFANAIAANGDLTCASVAAAYMAADSVATSSLIETNAAANGQVLSYNAATGNMTWTAAGAGDITSTQMAGTTTMKSFEFESSYWIGSTTIDKDYASFSYATSTFKIRHPEKGMAIQNLYCEIDSGTSLLLRCGDGTNYTELIVCDTDEQADDGSIANGTFTAREDVICEHGSQVGDPNSVTVTITYNNN